MPSRLEFRPGRQNSSAWEENVGDSTAALIELLGVYAEEEPDTDAAENELDIQTH